MSVTGNRSVTIEFADDVEYSQEFEAIVNGSSPGAVVTQVLASGANTITLPTGTTGVTIIPSDVNTVALTFKGIAGDTGVALALTSPSSFGVAASVTTFVLNAASAVTIRIIFS